MYVDSLKGLRVRVNPNLNGEIIRSLQNKTQVEVLQINEEKTNINGILGNWTLIRTGNIQGWVFGGYLVRNINDTSDNWTICETYRARSRPYPMSIESFITSNTSTFEFIAKIMKEYFYPNITTKDFYLAFYYPLVRYVPRDRDGLFQEVDIKILQDLTTHYFKYKSERSGEFSRIITIEQYKNNVLLKEMQFTLIFYEYYIECPELINSEFAQRIKLIDLIHNDLVLKVGNAYILDNLNVMDMSESIRLNEKTLYFLQKLYEKQE